MKGTMTIKIIIIGIILSLYLFGTEVFGETTMQILQVESLGLPTQSKQFAARKINALKVFNHRLYLGHGDAVVNTGPTDVIYYDFAQSEYKTEFTVDDEAIYRYEVVSGQLVIPGPDATESWDFGNIYVLAEHGWTKERTIPNGIHINDIVAYGPHWYCSTGCFYQFGQETEETYPFGGIFRSADEGKHWQLAYGTPYDEGSVYRVNRLVSFQGKLYGFYYAMLTLTKDQIPVRYHASLGDGYGGGYIVLAPDLFGSRDAIVYDGSHWGLVDLVPEEQVCTISAVVLGEKMVLAVLSGEYLDYMQLRTQRPEQARTRLYYYDGQESKPIDLDYDYLIDIVVKDNRLYLLMVHEQLISIVETEDLCHWTQYGLPGNLKGVRCLEYHDGSFLLGMEDGNIFKTSSLVGQPGQLSPNHEFPSSFHGVAEIPAEGQWYWTALTTWQQWAEPATISGIIRGEHELEVTVSNVSELLVFNPWSNSQNPSGRVSLRINEQNVFNNEAIQTLSWQCKLAKNGKWKAKPVRIQREEYVPEQRVVGKTDIPLNGRGHGSSYTTWKAEVIRQAAQADIALVSPYSVLGDLKPGPITLDDVFRTNQDHVICTFAMSGEEIQTLIEYNFKLAEKERVAISGFTISYSDHEADSQNVIEQISLEAQKKYRVAVSDGLMRYALENFGRSIPHDATQFKTRVVLVHWLEENRKIDQVPQTVFIRSAPPTQDQALSGE
ncbi:5'-nucleotidase C-terminal domain-containing protein [bacterium]|nr:5'-nucleotidase C-terminal domain-containing protein [bacterium]